MAKEPPIGIPAHLADLQRACDAAKAAVNAHYEANRPALEWTDETRAEAETIYQAWVTAAEALQAAIQEHGAEVGNGYKWRQALKAAAGGGEA